MAKNPERPKANKRERAARLYRNVNALGAVALFGLASIAPPLAAGGLEALAAIDVAQAGGAEVYRRHVKNKRKRAS